MRIPKGRPSLTDEEFMSAVSYLFFGISEIRISPGNLNKILQVEWQYRNRARQAFLEAVEKGVLSFNLQGNYLVVHPLDSNCSLGPYLDRKPLAFTNEKDALDFASEVLQVCSRARYSKQFVVKK